MKQLIFDTEDEGTKEKMLEVFRDLPDGKYLVRISRNKPIRSLKANAYYWVLLSIIATETGYEREQLHEICKRKFNSDVILYPSGEVDIVGKSTTALNSAEHAAYVNKIKMWAQDEWRINLPEPADIDYQRWMEIENNYNRSQSGW